MKEIRFKVKQILLALSISVSLFGRPNYGNIKVDSIVNVYDGDTTRVNINSYPPILGQNISIRVNGIDTPEMLGKCEEEKIKAKVAKYFTKRFLQECKEEISLKNISRGKYFRIVADVYCGEKSLAKGLLEDSLAVIYDGKKKRKNWCEE